MVTGILDRFLSVGDKGVACTLGELRALAAGLGPGYRGERLALPLERKQEIPKRVIEFLGGEGWGPVPAYLLDLAEGKETLWRERKAKLFEVGEFPEYGFRADAGTLRRLAENFEYPVPIFVEHVETPLRLGYLTQVEAVGNELFGLLALTPEAEELLEESGAKALSLAISREGDRIHEVSIVANPRVQTARLFCEDFHCWQGKDEWRVEALRLKDTLERERTTARVDMLVREGNLPPVLREKAESLLLLARARGMEGEVMDFLTSLPRFVVFQELAPSGRAVSSGLAGEGEEFYRAHFPGLPLEEIAKRFGG